MLSTPIHYRPATALILQLLDTPIARVLAIPE
jgi:hypothetical protein